MIQAAQYARENTCLFRHLPGHADHGHGVRPQRAGLRRRQFQRIYARGQHNVIDLMPDQQGVETKGGTMRLGKYPCVITPGTKMADCYGTTEIDERHRHRYEFNNEFRAEFEEKGLVIAGTSPDGRLVEAVEIPGRDFHLAHSSTPSSRAARTVRTPCSSFIAAALKFQSEHTPTGHPAVLGE